MPQDKALSAHYNQLIENIKKTLSEGLIAAQAAVEYQRVKTYWTIGREITRAVAGSNGELTLNRALYKRISQTVFEHTELRLTQDTIQRIIRFYKLYPKFPQNTSLPFTHYLTLMRISNAKTRQEIERKAQIRHLSILELKALVDEFQSTTKNSKNFNRKKLVYTRSEPFIYKVVTRKSVSGQEKHYVDCGFKICVELNGKILNQPLKAKTHINRTVRSVKNSSGYNIKLDRQKSDLLYTYCAQITRVVDGDTIDARIDLGFNIQVHDRFRLKNINAPELKTAAGRGASEFLTDYLKQCPTVIIRTFKEGVYGRWLADVFAIPGCEDAFEIARSGVYVNQLLLDKGLAEPYL